jgi:hypothetical protein
MYFPALRAQIASLMPEATHHKPMLPDPEVEKSELQPMQAKNSTENSALHHGDVYVRSQVPQPFSAPSLGWLPPAYLPGAAPRYLLKPVQARQVHQAVRTQTQTRVKSQVKPLEETVARGTLAKPKFIVKKPDYSISPDEIRVNRLLKEQDYWQAFVETMPWDAKDVIDPFLGGPE